MNSSQIRIKTEGFRAIDNADIIINGITVVTGENGSGKSTISKLLYYLYKTASNYDSLVKNELKFKLRNIERFLEIVITELYKITGERNTREEFNQLTELKNNFNTVDQSELEKWISFVQKVENNFYSQPSLFKDNSNLPPSFSQKISQRLSFIVKDLFEGEKGYFDNEGTLNPFKKVVNLLEILFEDSFKKIKSRPVSLFLQELKNLYPERQLPRSFEVFEFEDQIVSISKSSLSIPYLIQNSIYIDTPMMIGVDYSDNEHWDDLNELLLKKGKSTGLKLSSTISGEIINGDVNIIDNGISSDDFSFKRDDGSVYRLLDCATGVKSFAILQLLLKNGSLTNKSLLIIDEPESHLHPQWIIEYARIIVLLNKELGIKFFIASHNPDMISAIRYISEKENVLQDVNFYLAEKTGSDFKYSYNHLGTDIDPIFASFNIALDRINQYGI